MKWTALFFAAVLFSACELGLGQRHTVPIVATDLVTLNGTGYAVDRCIIDIPASPPDAQYFQCILVTQGMVVDGAGSIITSTSNGDLFQFNLPYPGDFYGKHDLTAATSGFQWITYNGGGTPPSSTVYDASVIGTLVIQQTPKGVRVRAAATFGGSSLVFDYEGPYILK